MLLFDLECSLIFHIFEIVAVNDILITSLCILSYYFRIDFNII